MELAIRHVANGIEIAARMHKGDLQAVQGQWSELQAALAERGASPSAVHRAADLTGEARHPLGTGLR